MQNYDKIHRFEKNISNRSIIIQPHEIPYRLMDKRRIAILQTDRCVLHATIENPSSIVQENRIFAGNNSPVNLSPRVSSQQIILLQISGTLKFDSAA